VRDIALRSTSTLQASKNSRQADGSTRLVVRERYGYSHRWARLLVEPVELISFLMSQRMLRGIKERAERAVGSVATAAVVPATPMSPRPTEVRT
jgi:hypothetical protein